MKIFLEILCWFFYGISFKQGKVWSKFKFFVGASNFLKSAFEHNTAKTLCRHQAKIDL